VADAAPCHPRILRLLRDGMFILGGLCYALLLILAFVGWGRFVALFSFGKITGEWPFHAAWGVCGFALAGGVLNVLGKVSAPVNLALIAAGVALAGIGRDWRELLASVRRFRELPRAVRLAAIGFVLLAGGTLVISLFPLTWDSSDDSIAYAVFPMKMIQAGSLIEPFSHRRIIGYGAHPYLQTLVLSWFTHHVLTLLDRGILTVLAAAAIASYARLRLDAPPLIALLIGMIFILAPPLRINLSPVSVFSLLSLTLLETVQLTRSTPFWRRAILLTLVSAALVAMRANAVSVVGIMLVFLLVFEERATGKPMRPGNKLALLVMIGAMTAAVLAPYAVTLYRSSGTPFYPLITGYYNRAIGMSAPFHPAQFLGSLWKSVSFSGLHYLVIATLLGLAVRAIPAALACYVASTIVTALALFSIVNLWGIEVLDRYYSPFVRVAEMLVLAAWCAYAVRVRAQWRNPAAPFWRFPRWALPAAAVLAVPAAGAVAYVSTDRNRARDWSKASLHRSLEGRIAGPYRGALTMEASYRAAEAVIPKGARVLAMVDAPFLLDFREHDIWITDDVGVVSPPPHFPITDGPAAFANYLGSLSVDYVLAANPNRRQREGVERAYTRNYWETSIDAQNINNRFRAPYYLWMFDAIGNPPASCKKVYDADDVIVIALRK
jgi:hypothetical protein